MERKIARRDWRDRPAMEDELDEDGLIKKPDAGGAARWLEPVGQQDQAEA